LLTTSIFIFLVLKGCRPRWRHGVRNDFIVFAQHQPASAIRTVMAIAERMPEVGRRYYEEVLEKTIDRLAAYLDARVKANELAIDDCQHAASQFMLMCQASLFLPFVFQAAPPPSAARIREVVESATRVFLAAYGVKAV